MTLAFLRSLYLARGLYLDEAVEELDGSVSLDRSIASEDLRRRRLAEEEDLEDNRQPEHDGLFWDFEMTVSSRPHVSFCSLFMFLFLWMFLAVLVLVVVIVMFLSRGRLGGLPTAGA